ncbi:M28 family metallopeptidase [Chondrinema litorale]|uniref:M28 family metallopeptidase n=1 Tax=Chondrinema litorale TaxID=2994555 RepID=UPI002542CEEB|nr:M28 family metallopeptidase [Chondrinema litorale]UZR99935.1 M28 family metallopeptidase [Chondrinema litorale]
MNFKNVSLSITFLFAVVFTSCNKGEEKPQTSKITADEISYYLKTLASDDFEGRKPFTEGETKTLNFLESEFKKMGLEPGNRDSYFQEVPMVETTGIPAETMEVKGAESFTFKVKDDFIVYTERETEKASLNKSELVFCGYGIVAPEYNWNDYEGIDMKGKTAVVLVNDPGFGSEDSTFFKGNIMTYYGRWTYKYEEAARQGAEGIIIVHETRSAGYPWSVVANSWSGAKLNLVSEDKGASKCAIQGWITLKTAAQLFKAAGIDNYTGKAATPGFKPESMGMSVSVSLENKLQYDESKNVLAKITGSNKADEVILYSAHWDHLGIGLAIDNDSIYNGALDNASGVACMMAIAQNIKKSGIKPERTILFNIVTAEEQGLLGSAYYVSHPVYPIEKTVANLNMDMMAAFGEMKDLTVIGYGQSELEDYAEEIAKTQGRYIMPNQHPGAGLFFRSDHFNFAKVGIPAFFASGAYEHKEKGKEYAKEQMNNFTSNDYHRPSDEYRPETQDLGGMVQDAELYMDLGLKLANEPIYPKWKDGSEFKQMRP